MSTETDPHPTSDGAPSPSAADAKRLIDVTVPVPAAYLGSFYRAVAAFLEEEHEDEGWRGGRMTTG